MTIQGTCWIENMFYCEQIMNIDFNEDKRKLPKNHYSNIQGSYQPTPNPTKFHCPINTLQ